MAIPKIKSTYALDLDTVRTLETVARRWGVSKSEALRRAIRAVAGQDAGPSDPIAALNQLQGSVRLTAAQAQRWSAGTRSARRAASARREPRGA